jgi:hypothetical protein
MRLPPWDESHPDWPEAKKVLDAIPGFIYNIDRGYFEWSSGLERGLSDKPCSSDRFGRFVTAIRTHQPRTLDALEELFP